jgi:hypothetical protein
MDSEKDHAKELLSQKDLPKTLGLTNGFYSIEAYPGQDVNAQQIAIKPVFCRKLITKVCDPNHIDKTPTKTIQAIIVENNTPVIKVIKDGNQVTTETPILCANCRIANLNKI